MRLVFKNGARIQMASAVCVSVVERCVLSFWVVDPSQTPQNTFRVVCADFKPRRKQVPTPFASNRYKMT